MIQVYRVTFDADGAQYVGMTKREMGERLKYHVLRPDNQELASRLKHGDAYEVEVVSRHPTMDEAMRAEAALIAELAKPINLTYATAPQATRYVHRVWVPGARPRKPPPGKARCSLCRAHLPASGFWRTAGRHNGLDSRCKYCRTALRGLRGAEYQARKDELRRMR